MKTMKTMKTKLLYTLFLVVAYLATTTYSHAQISSCGVDKCAELVGIVYRLAQFPEYSSGNTKSYNDDIDNYFADYVDHPVIKLAREYRANYGLSYDAAMQLGIHIKIDKEAIRLDERIYNNMDGRWSKERLELFVKELSDFYKKTDFDKFFKSHSDLYSLSGSTVKNIVDKIYYPWFNDFWGTEPIDNYNIVVCVVSGCGNYGLKIINDSGKEDVYAVLGVCRTDSLDRPVYETDDLISLFVHEINHSYDKGLTENKDKLRKSGEVIFPFIADRMTQNAYGTWDSVLEEAMVRAGVINYMENDPLHPFDVNKQIAYEKTKGFFWIEKLTKEFEIYTANRDQYPSIKEFMPRIVKLYDDLADEMSAPGFSFPEVEKISIENNSVVDTSLGEIIITFNRPMITNGYGINPGSLGRESFPKFDKIEWIDNQNLRLAVALEENKKYSITLYIPAYSDTEGFPVMKNFDLVFETR